MASSPAEPSVPADPASTTFPNPVPIEISIAEIEHARHRPWLVQGRERPTIVVLTDNIDRTRDGYESSLRHGFQQRCRDLGINLVFVVGRIADAGEPRADPHNLILHMVGPTDADGIILLSPGLEGNCGIDLQGELLPRLRPLPTCSVGLALPDTPSIVHDGRAGMVKVVEHLVRDHGRRRVLYLHGIPTNPDAIVRLDACREAMRRSGLLLGDDAVGVGNFNDLEGYQAARAKLEQDPTFDAIVAANDGMALGAYDALRERGVVPGSSASVTGFDDMADARFCDPSLTTVSQPLHQMARAAVDLIAAQWLDRPVPAVTTIEADLIIRNSCGCGRHGIQLPPSVRPPAEHNIASFLAAMSEHLAASIAPRLGYPPETSLDKARQLVRAVELELTAEPGALLRQINTMVDELLQWEIPGLGLVQAVLALGAALPRESGQTLEKLWPTLHISVMASSARYQLEQRRRVECMYASLIEVGYRILTALDREALARAVSVSLRTLQCTTAHLGLLSDQCLVTMAHVVSNVPLAVATG